MGTPKLMLDFHGKSFLEHIFEEASHSALTEVKVVLGHNAGQVQSQFPNLKGKWLVNSEYERGQLSSIQCGLAAFLRSSIDGVMILLIDHPFVDHMLINQLIESFDERHSLIVVPSYEHRRGHPVIFSKALFEELLNASLDQGASDVIRKHQKEVFHVNVSNPGVLIDIDTPEDYLRFVLTEKTEKQLGGIT